MILAGLLHVAVSTVLAYVASAIWGRLTPTIAFFSLLVGMLVAASRSDRLNSGFESFRVRAFGTNEDGWLEKALFLFLIYAGARHFIWHLYISGHDIRTLNISNFGDLPLHVNYIRQMANGVDFPVVNPIYVLEKLRYPLGTDLYSALWEILGMGTQAHIFVFGIFATVASLVALRAWAGWWGIGGFFLNGGWAGWELLRTGQVSARLAEAVAWKNFFLTVFITQRGILFALPVGIALLYFARRMFRGEITPSKTQLRWFGFLWGSLALFHLHTFFVVSVLLPVFALMYRESQMSLRLFRGLLLWALPVGSAFTLYLTAAFGKAGVAHWRAGWMSGAEGFTKFAIFNFGPWIILTASLPLAIVVFHGSKIEKETRRLLTEWIVYVALFGLFLNLMLAPWEWDNVKVLIWPYIGLLGVAASAFAPVQGKWWVLPLKSALAITLFFSGAIAVGKSLAGTLPSVTLYNISDLASTEGALKNVPANAVIAAAPTHDHSLPWFGRQRVLGYEGHNWSHGIKTQALMADLEKVMRSAPDWREAAGRTRATHIFWGPAERRFYGDAEPAWKTVLPNVSPVAGYEIYALQTTQ